MPIATRNGMIVVVNGHLTETCACCGEQICGCSPDESIIPAAFDVTFSDLSIAMDTASFSVGTPLDRSSYLADFLSGISPVRLIRRSFSQLQRAGYYNYSTRGCYETGSGCTTYPPGYFSLTAEPAFGIGTVPTLGIDVPCAGKSLVMAWSGSTGSRTVEWSLTSDGVTFPNPTIRLTFSGDELAELFDTSLCEGLPDPIAVPCTVRPRTSLGIGTQVFSSAGNGAAYSGSGTVTFEAVFNPLP